MGFTSFGGSEISNTFEVPDIDMAEITGRLDVITEAVRAIDINVHVAPAQLVAEIDLGRIEAALELLAELGAMIASTPPTVNCPEVTVNVEPTPIQITNDIKLGLIDRSLKLISISSTVIALVQVIELVLGAVVNK